MEPVDINRSIFIDHIDYFMYVLIVSQLSLWDPKDGRRGRPATTFVDQMEEDTGISRQELPALMAGRGEWDKLRIKSVRILIILITFR